MRTAGSVLCVFALTFSLDAQITTTLKHLPDGLDEVRIRNNSANRLVAFVVAVKQVPLSIFSSNAPFAVYSDPLIEPAARPLMASEERVVMSRIFQDPSGRWRRLLAEPTASAGIFADGTTAGDAALLTRLMIRRSSMLQAVETALETLSDAGRHNMARDQLIGQFKKLADSVSHWYLSPELQVGLDLYQSIIGKLVDLPEEPVGLPFPPSAFVTEETAMLNRQRVILLESQPSLADTTFISNR